MIFRTPEPLDEPLSLIGIFLSVLTFQPLIQENPWWSPVIYMIWPSCTSFVFSICFYQLSIYNKLKDKHIITMEASSPPPPAASDGVFCKSLCDCADFCWFPDCITILAAMIGFANPFASVHYGMRFWRKRQDKKALEAGNEKVAST